MHVYIFFIFATIYVNNIFFLIILSKLIVHVLSAHNSETITHYILRV